ncbi:MAG: hypothetical protein WBM78_21035 [Desulfobacterales bacterium]
MPELEEYALLFYQTLQVTLHEAFHGTKRVLEWEDGRKIDAKIPHGVKTAKLRYQILISDSIES